jgi:hypothetical protein
MLPGALADTLRSGDGPAIAITQVGEVNSGAVDPLPELVEVATDHGAWVTSTAHLACGLPQAPHYEDPSRESSAPTRGRPTRTSG